jgi:hypothetical protein
MYQPLVDKRSFREYTISDRIYKLRLFYTGYSVKLPLREVFIRKVGGNGRKTAKCPFRKKRSFP